ncbi:hypothetical protein Ae263Ps1_6312 [Pseudonocardia sp. Ae263_Ps1]|nr:hypothetical protein Ae263Ps1_6312 [Pseudonocardia sp. Ae263_Ps1]OLL89209.1 hypothetical protein Ae356Ps1_6128c [Pseudonocardia sp. Ae356_Ps1]
MSALTPDRAICLIEVVMVKVRNVVRRAMLGLVLGGAVLVGAVVFPGPAYAGLPSDPETCAAENAVVLVPCPPATDFDRSLNVTRLRFTLAPQLRAHLTVTLETENGQGRHQQTIPFVNASDRVVESSWSVGAYDQGMGVRIVRAEWHPG